ncbi:MAG: SUMF1/EgtB/PvdO family nonheme iron enzyme, partial [Pseudomonadota bacterium]
MNKRRLINGLMIAGLISPLIILPFAGFGRDAAPAQDRGSEEVFGNPELPLFSDRFEPPIELTINSNVPSIHASSSQMLTFTFAEDVFGFDADDILIGPGAFTGQFSQVNAAVYTLEVQSSGGRITVNVPNRAALSAISGTGTAAASFSNFRSDRPTISLPGGETMVLIRVPAGSFMMGSPEDELSRRDDEAQHEVTLSRDFYIGRDEVTQAQWLAVMGDFPEP